jgi:sugar/nucleoside kinase (ribokinase family)
VKKVVTFGEIMLRLSPPGLERFLQSPVLWRWDRTPPRPPRAPSSPREAGARVSFDLNYRRKLWTEAEAQRVVGPLLRNVDLVVANEEDFQSVLGIQVANTDVAAGRLAIEG